MEIQKIYPFLREYQGRCAAKEVLSFVETNPELADLLTSTAQRCNSHIINANTGTEEGFTLSERLIKLQGLLDQNFKGSMPITRAVRNLETGVGIILGIKEPGEHLAMLSKKIIRGGCSTFSARLDIAWYPQPPYGIDPFKVLTGSGIQIIAGCGETKLDIWGRIADEDLYGVRIYICDTGNECFGSAIRFKGPGLSIPKGILRFNGTHGNKIAKLKSSIGLLSFLPQEIEGLPIQKEVASAPTINPI